MKNKAHISSFGTYQNFIQALRLTQLQSELDIFVLDINQISEEVLDQFALYRNDFFEINFIKDQFNFKFSVDGILYHPQGKPYICFVSPWQLQSFEFLADDLDQSQDFK